MVPPFAGQGLSATGPLVYSEPNNLNANVSAVDLDSQPLAPTALAATGTSVVMIAWEGNSDNPAKGANRTARQIAGASR